jgi:hypothetical protein
MQSKQTIDTQPLRDLSLDHDERPLALREAAERYGLTVSTLRTEAARGRLTIYRIGRKHFTKPSDIAEMIQKCRVEPSRHASISIHDVTNGLSEKDRVSSALERAKASVARLSNSSRGT